MSCKCAAVHVRHGRGKREEKRANFRALRGNQRSVKGLTSKNYAKKEIHTTKKRNKKKIKNIEEE